MFINNSFDFEQCNKMVQPVPETINFPSEEEKVLAFWNEIDAFQTSLKLSKGRPR